MGLPNIRWSNFNRPIFILMAVLLIQWSFDFSDAVGESDFLPVIKRVGHGIIFRPLSRGSYDNGDGELIYPVRVPAPKLPRYFVFSYLQTPDYNRTWLQNVAERFMTPLRHFQKRSNEFYRKLYKTVCYAGEILTTHRKERHDSREHESVNPFRREASWYKDHKRSWSGRKRRDAALMELSDFISENANSFNLTTARAIYQHFYEYDKNFKYTFGNIFLSSWRWLFGQTSIVDTVKLDIFATSVLAESYTNGLAVKSFENAVAESERHIKKRIDNEVMAAKKILAEFEAQTYKIHELVNWQNLEISTYQDMFDFFFEWVFKLIETTVPGIRDFISAMDKTDHALGSYIEGLRILKNGRLAASLVPVAVVEDIITDARDKQTGPGTKFPLHTVRPDLDATYFYEPGRISWWVDDPVSEDSFGDLVITLRVPIVSGSSIYNIYTVEKFYIPASSGLFSVNLDPQEDGYYYLDNVDTGDMIAVTGFGKKYVSIKKSVADASRMAQRFKSQHSARTLSHLLRNELQFNAIEPNDCLGAIFFHGHDFNSSFVLDRCNYVYLPQEHVPYQFPLKISNGRSLYVNNEPGSPSPFVSDLSLRCPSFDLVSRAYSPPLGEVLVAEDCRVEGKNAVLPGYKSAEDFTDVPGKDRFETSNRDGVIERFTQEHRSMSYTFYPAFLSAGFALNSTHSLDAHELFETEGIKRELPFHLPRYQAGTVWNETLSEASNRWDFGPVTTDTEGMSAVDTVKAAKSRSTVRYNAAQKAYDTAVQSQALTYHEYESLSEIALDTLRYVIDPFKWFSIGAKIEAILGAVFSAMGLAIFNLVVAVCFFSYILTPFFVRGCQLPSWEDYYFTQF